MPKLKFQTAKEIAVEKGLSYDIVREAVRNGHVRTVTLGRRALVPKGAWEEFVERRTYEPLPRKETTNA